MNREFFFSVWQTSMQCTNMVYKLRCLKCLGQPSGVLFLHDQGNLLVDVGVLNRSYTIKVNMTPTAMPFQKFLLGWIKIEVITIKYTVFNKTIMDFNP